jgi:hypothetical protein
VEDPVSEKELFSELLPNSFILRLEDESISNGFQPDSRTGISLNWALLHLAGQMRSFAVMGPYIYVAHDVPLELSFLLKPWARDVEVVLVWEAYGVQEDGREFLITLELISGSTTRVFAQDFTTNIAGEAIPIEAAYENSFTFSGVGDDPGKAANRDENAVIRITPNNADIGIFSIAVLQHHSVRLFQDDP